MNRYLFFAFLYFFIPACAFAQAPFNTVDSVNVNNINAAVLVHGDMWWNPSTYIPACEFPAGSGKNMNYASAIWMAAYDGSGQLHVAAQTYRQTGNDFWPGPLTSDTLTYATSQNWANIWKVNSSDIHSFLSFPTHTTTNTPQSILTWPGKGNTYAAGNGGVSLTVITDMAPFVDLNGDGIYEPLLGEYPDIKGDQALWWVFSDNGPTHNSSNGKPLGVEVHAMSYAYNRGTLIDNVIYYDYTIVNRSSNSYSNMRMALWDDVVELGWYYDDYIGFDSAKRMGIMYEGRSTSGGYPVNSYGPDPPIPAVTMVVLPGDTATDYVPAGSFTYFYNDSSVIGNPTIDTQYNNYMRAKMLNGQHYTNDSGQNCNYVFSGNPTDTSEWSQCSGNYHGGEMFVISSNDFTLNASGTQHLVLALITTNLGPAQYCPLTSFDSIKIVADTAWANYFNPPAPNGIKNISINNSISIYPNPTHDILYVQTIESIVNDEYIAIYNLLGQKINLPIAQNNTEDIIDVSSLPPALYYIVYRKDNVQKTAKFVKE